MNVKETIKDVTDKIGSMISRDSEPEILDTLKKEHEEVADLLKKLTQSERGAERKSLLAKIEAALVPHTKAEEAVLYDPLIADADKKAEQDGREGYFEHELASRMLDTLKTLKPDSISFGAGAKVLKELVEHHVAEEERNVWSDAKKAFSLETRKEMNARYLAAKAKVSLPAKPPVASARAKSKPVTGPTAVIVKSSVSSKKTPPRKAPAGTKTVVAKPTGSSKKTPVHKKPVASPKAQPKA